MSTNTSRNTFYSDELIQKHGRPPFWDDWGEYEMEHEDRLTRLEIEVRNNTKQLEKIIKNDLPHINKSLAYVMGKLSVMQPLNVGIAVGVILTLIAVVLKFVGLY